MNRLCRWMFASTLLVATATASASAVDQLVARGVVRARAIPAVPAPLSLLVTGGAPDLHIRSLRAWIDGSELPRYEYSDVEAEALAGGAMHSFDAPALAAGAHRLRAELIAVDPRAASYAPRTRVQIDENIVVSGDAPVAVQLRFASATTVRKAALHLHTSMFSAEVASRVARLLLADGRVFEAATFGDLVLDRPVEPPAQAWMLDRANVARGEALLASREGAAAADAFRRVRSAGPFTSRALLGLGWSALIPQGREDEASRLRPATFAMPQTEDAIAQARRRTPFRYLDAVASGERADDLRRALAAWMELVGRDPLDPAVQQGMLAVPYALLHLGSQAQAADYASRAAEQLEITHSLVERALAEVQTKLLPSLDAYLADERNGWHWQLAALASTRRWWRDGTPDATFYAGALLDDAQVEPLLQDYRRLHLLLRFLDRTGADAELRADAAAAQEEIASQIRSAAAQCLERHRNDVRRTLAETHLFLARLHDRDVAVAP